MLPPPREQVNGPQPNGLLGDRHERMLAVFRRIDPATKRRFMAHGAEIISRNVDIKTAVQMLLER